MLESFSTPRNRTRTLLFLGLCALLAIAAAGVGIDDNPPGIALALLSAASLVLAFAHPWRSAARFRRLIYVSILGFVLLLAAGVALQILVESTSLPGLASQILAFVGTASLLGAGFLCIPGLLVGIIGALLMRRRERNAGRLPE
jgi:hypothetical protein